ncbi:MAG: HAD family phosphatase [Patescibacteria group bacterium]
MRKIAIFDIDGTIFRSSLLIELTDALVRDGVMPADAGRAYSKARNKWLDREGSYEDYIGAVIRAFEGRMKGLEHKKFMGVAKRVVGKSGTHVYRYTRDLAANLKKRGYFLLAISNSPKEVLDPFCKLWGFDKVYGRIYEVGPDGRYTGRTSYHDLITDKAKILKRAAAKEGLTLTGSVGVGDSESDIPFLKLVSSPICFNPNSKLYAAAKRNGWKVVVERKDVVYQF